MKWRKKEMKRGNGIGRIRETGGVRKQRCKGVKEEKTRSREVRDRERKRRDEGEKKADEREK